MFTSKNNYYLFIENSKILNFNLIKNKHKFTVIYRNKKPENLDQLKILRNKCRRKGVKLFIANNFRMAEACRANGVYLSSHNKKFCYNNNLEIIGSAHNQEEIYQKIKQKCSRIIFSRLFKTDYKNKKDWLGINKFNFFNQKSNVELVPFGGIRVTNLHRLRMIKCNSFAIMSELKNNQKKLLTRLK